MSPDVKRDWRLYAEGIIEACAKVRRYIAGMTFADRHRAYKERIPPLPRSRCPRSPGASSRR